MQQLLLLHGAIGAMSQFSDIENKLSSSFLISRLNFSGHGGLPFVEQPFSIKNFATEVIIFLDKNNIERINIFGYSMGGYVAMFLARHYPKRVDKIITLATKFSWDEAIAANEINMLNPAKILEKLPGFAAGLQKRHAPNNWQTVLEKTVIMLREMGAHNPLHADDYKDIRQPVLLMLGDRDKMVTLDETLQVYKSLPLAQLAVLPNTAHPIERVNRDRLAFEISSFLA